MRLGARRRSAARTCSSSGCRPRPGVTARCARPAGLTSSSTASRLESSVGKARVLRGDGMRGASGDRATERRRRRQREWRGGEASQPVRPPVGPRRVARVIPSLPSHSAAIPTSLRALPGLLRGLCGSRSIAARDDRPPASPARLHGSRGSAAATWAAEAAAAGCAHSCWKLAFDITTLLAFNDSIQASYGLECVCLLPQQRQRWHQALRPLSAPRQAAAR